MGPGDVAGWLLLYLATRASKKMRARESGDAKESASLCELSRNKRR
jgi:hypothetical protein